MIDRRQLLIAGACFGAAAGTAALTPRRSLSLLGKAKIEDITPRVFGGWREVLVGQVVQPREEGSLSDQLYSQLLTRVYHHAQSGDSVMLAIAYGDTQSDLLQLHRPESCYRSFGFELSQSSVDAVPLIGGAQILTRNLLATAPGRVETVSYWTRVGEFLPTSQREQTLNKLRTSMQGLIADGILVRCSTLGENLAQAKRANHHFQAALIAALAPANRAAFVGSALAAQLAAAVATSGQSKA